MGYCTNYGFSIQLWRNIVKRRTVKIRPFQPANQIATQALILDGLADHWNTLDPMLNPDLNNIAYSYRGETFLLAWQENEIIGCGALVVENKTLGYGRIVRMSVKKEFRRQKIGQLILNQLETAAKQRGFHKLVLETTETWGEVIKFYQANGFHIIGQLDGDIHFEKNL
jgi:ribosomal protein S18 acetylase RimI-like enzyme